MLRRLVPDAVTLQLLGKVHAVADLHRKIADRIVVAGMLVPAVFWLEYLWMGWRDCSVRHLLVERTASGRSDLSCFLFGLSPTLSLISAAMSLGVVFISGDWLRQHLARATGVDLSIAALPLAVQTAVLFLLYSLFDYWSHRLDHSRAFWPLHRFHHAAEDFSVLTAARTHPAVFTAVVGTVLPGMLLGSKPEALADLGLIVMTIRLVIHSRIESDFGWVGRWIVQSPLHHRLHHSLNRQPINLGLLPIWDRLFGTWRETGGRPMRIGASAPYRHGAWIAPDIWRDYREFWAGLLRLACGRPA
jgi:sterol desaturase/sphingolipid hydroxylase (fatty acid hydroxylase superfamily)